MNRREMLLSTTALLAARTSPKRGSWITVPSLTCGSAPAPTPFRIAFGAERITDLHRRLDATRWPDVPFETGWSHGTNLTVLRDLTRYWRHQYDWPRAQAAMNRLPHYTLPVEGERLHFVWYKGSGPRQPFPLLLLHGWPSSFLEFREAAPLLVNGSDGRPGFDLVVPSLPGFVFSDAPRAPGMHPGLMAKRIHALMTALGYTRYGVDGGDWGWAVGRDLAALFPQSVVGLQLHGAPWEEPKGREPTAEERAFLERWERFVSEELGYQAIQRTRPQTLAFALNDSPVGLLAWMLEKYWAWSDHGDDLWASIDRDYLLTTVTLYWLTGRVLSSSSAYYEMNARPAADWPSEITVPTALSPYPKDPWTPPKSLLAPQQLKKIVRYTEPPRGGHFQAMEEPKFWAEDVRTFFTELVR